VRDGILFQRSAGHRRELAHDAVGSLARDRQLALALELLDGCPGIAIDDSGRLDLPIAVVGKRSLQGDDAVRRCRSFEDASAQVQTVQWASVGRKEPSRARSGVGGGPRPTVVCVAITGFVCSEAPLNIGAGCEPDCMNSTLTRTVIVSRAPRTAPKASPAFKPTARSKPPARLPQGALFPSARIRHRHYPIAPQRALPQS